MTNDKFPGGYPNALFVIGHLSLVISGPGRGSPCPLSLLPLGFSQWFQSRGEVAEERRLVRQAQALNPLALPPDLQHNLDYVIDVALSVDAARDRQTHQIHVRGIAKHQGSDFDGSNPSFQI